MVPFMKLSIVGLTTERPMNELSIFSSFASMVVKPDE